MIIYCPELSSRLSYIFHFIMQELLGLNYVLTDNLKIFKRADSPKFFYGFDNPFEKEMLFLKASPLLFEQDIKNIDIQVFPFKNTKAFFKTNEFSFFPFDIFAASFYLLSRYEEYLDYVPDKFGRFPAKKSLALKHDFIEQPVINIWAEHLKTTLLKHYPNLKFKQNKFRYLSTIDIDNAYAYRYKGFIRSSLAYAKLILNLDFTGVFEKTLVHFNLKNDPYNSYDYLIKVHQKHQLKAIFFFLTGAYAKYDKNISPKGKAFKKLVQKIATYYKIGIHPSFASNTNLEILKNEKKVLEKVAEQSIFVSRQHFLILKIPETYQNLLKIGIKEDYSMGFAETPGFRAGTCTPFYFFDLLKNKEEKLKIIPFSVMDVGLKDYNAYNTLQAEQKIKKIIKNVKKVNGLFVSLWHNESLGTKKQWKNWQNVYEKMIEFALNPDEN